MKEFSRWVIGALVLLTAVLLGFIFVAATKIWSSTDPLELERFKIIVGALMPALSPLLVFLAATGIFKMMISAANNVQLLAHDKPPEPIRPY